MKRVNFRFIPVSKTGYDKTVQEMCAIVEYPCIDKYEADPAANCPCVVEGSILAERNQLVQVLKRAVQNDQIEEFKVWK